MIPRDDADRQGLNGVRGTLIALGLSALFWAVLGLAWWIGQKWVR